MIDNTIIINGKPFTYQDEIKDITYDTISPISVEDATALLKKTKELFENCGFSFCLAFGTLLGAVRDHTIIPKDEDVDVFVEDEDKLYNSLPYLYNQGLKICRIHKGVLYSFRLNNRSYIDVYIKRELPKSIWRIYCDCLYGKAVPKWYIYKYDKIEFLGDTYLCPHKPERILAFWYGKNWRTPVRGHTFTYETPSRYWWLHEGGKAKWETVCCVLSQFMHNPVHALIKSCKFIIREIAK